MPIVHSTGTSAIRRLLGAKIGVNAAPPQWLNRSRYLLVVVRMRVDGPGYCWQMTGWDKDLRDAHIGEESRPWLPSRG